MRNIKKPFVALGAFLLSLISKVHASAVLMVEEKYGVFDPEMVQTKYGVFTPEPTIGEKISNVGRFVLPIVLFLIGLFVVLSKKITKKVKIIVVSILVLALVLGYMLLNHIKVYY